MVKFIEKLMVICVIAAAVGLIAFNILLRADYLETSYSPAGEKGVNFKQSQLYRGEYLIKLNISDEQAKLLVNGEEIIPDKDEQGYLLFSMCPSDVASIDLRDIKDRTVSVFVAYTDEDVLSPVVGTKMMMQGGIKTLFTLKISEY